VSLTAEDVREIMRLLEESAFDELDLETEGFRLTLRRSASGEMEQVAKDGSPLPLAGRGQEVGVVAKGSNDPDARPGPFKSSPRPPTPAPPPQGGRGKRTRADASLVDVPAPLLGVFYRAPKPGAPPFVEVGQTIEADAVIGIIEVMKLMNSVRAGVAGEIVEIPAQNAAMVEYGETLIRVRTKG
jgi:acetyl-CoA carboxylase biotin carboxyl carrier protein